MPLGGVERDQPVRAVAGEPVRGVEPVGKPADQGELPALSAESVDPAEGAVGAGLVAVEGDDDGLSAEARHLLDLRWRGGGAEGRAWRDLLDEAWHCGCGGDREGVEGAFDDDDGRIGDGPVRRSVEALALVEGRGAGGVAVFRCSGVAAGVAADEPGDPAVRAGDGDDEPVAEGVDEPSLTRGLRQVHRDELIVGDATRAEVVDQVRPAVAGVADQFLPELELGSAEVDAAVMAQVADGEGVRDRPREPLPGKGVDLVPAAGVDVGDDV